MHDFNWKTEDEVKASYCIEIPNPSTKLQFSYDKKILQIKIH